VSSEIASVRHPLYGPTRRGSPAGGQEVVAGTLSLRGCARRRPPAALCNCFAVKAGPHPLVWIRTTPDATKATDTKDALRRFPDRARKLGRHRRATSDATCVPC